MRGSVSIHMRFIQSLAIEMIRDNRNLSPSTMKLSRKRRKIITKKSEQKCKYLKNEKTFDIK